MAIHPFKPRVLAGNASLACIVCSHGETHTEHASTVKLPLYGGKRGFGLFRILTIEDVKTLKASHIWFVGINGDARECKVNGKVKLWKRDSDRIEIPLKYGMYEYATFTADDINAGRALQLIQK